MRPPFAKYSSKRVTHAGRSFASKLEAALYDELALREKAGELCNLRCQPHVFLTEARIEMIPDFCAEQVNAFCIELIYFEAKGFETTDWRIKKRLWSRYGPAPLRIYKGTHKRFFMAEEITPKVRIDGE